MGTLSKIIVWIIIILVVLQNLGVNITALLAGVGIALAFAAQSVLADLFSFLAIVIDKPFLVGDFIDTGNIS